MRYIVAHHSIAKIGFLVSQNIKCSFYKWQTLGAHTRVNLGGFVYVIVYSLCLRGAGLCPVPRNPRERLQRLLFCLQKSLSGKRDPAGLVLTGHAQKIYSPLKINKPLSPLAFRNH